MFRCCTLCLVLASFWVGRWNGILYAVGSVYPSLAQSASESIALSIPLSLPCCQVTPAAASADPGGELRACSVCGGSHGVQHYSKSQWKRGSKRRCHVCCQTQRDPEPGAAATAKRRKVGAAAEAAPVSYGIDEGKNAEYWRARWAAACATVQAEQQARSEQPPQHPHNTPTTAHGLPLPGYIPRPPAFAFHHVAACTPV